MSYTSIPNQPIIFNSVLPEGCEGCGSEYSQLVDFNDQLFWQLEAGQCEFADRTLESVIADWTQSGSTITANGTSTGGYAAFYARFDVVQYFLLTVTVYDIVGELNVLMVSGTSQTITTQGTHKIYLTTFDLTTGIVGILFTNGAQPFDGSFSVDNFQPIPNGALFAGIVNATTLAVVKRLDLTGTVNNQYLTSAINLADYEIEPGCYRLAIADYCTNTCGQYFIYNPYFNSVPRIPVGWTSTPVVGSDDWNVGNGEAQIDLTVIGNAAELVSITELCEDTTYYVEIEVESIINARLRLQVDGINYGTSISTAGTYNFTITVTQSGAVGLFGSQFGASLNGEITVKRITVRVDKNSAKYDMYSDLISIGDYSDDCRFFKIEGCNGENQFGLGFNGTSFLPGIRLEGRRFQAQYDTDTDLFRYASGRWQASYVDRKKKLSYYFGRLPEYVFDFLSIVFYFDNCYINGDTVFPADNEFPTIEYDNADDLGALTIDLYNKLDKVRKTVCIGVDANCLPSILDLDTEPFILAQDGDRLLTQDNINLYQE
jgi:hypothetical protein